MLRVNFGTKQGHGSYTTKLLGGTTEFMYVRGPHPGEGQSMESFLVRRMSQTFIKGIPRVGIHGRERTKEAPEEGTWNSCVDHPENPSRTQEQYSS